MSQKRRDAKLLAKIGELTLASTTKISTIFFAGIAMTVAGGLVTAVTHSGPPGAEPDRRFPASAGTLDDSASAISARSAAFGARNFASSSASRSRSGSDAASAAAADLQRAAEAQQAANATGEQPTPISVTPDATPLPNQPGNLASEVSAIAAATNTAISSSTATGTANTNGYGGSVNSPSNTSTNTSTSVIATPDVTVPAAIALATSSDGWSDVCQLVKVKLKDMFGNDSTARSPLLVSLTSNSGSFYSDSACGSSASSVGINAGSTGAAAYFKSNTSAQLSGYEPSLGGGSANVTIGEPAAAFAAGQSDLVTGTANTGAQSAATMNLPAASLQVSGKLVVADTANNRVLIWNSAPGTSGAAANIVLGQPDMVSHTANFGGLVLATTLSAPNAVGSDGTRLFVSDAGNHRVLIWDTIPTTTQQAASHVVGQPSLTVSGANNPAISGATLSSPSCVLSYAGKLIVCDRGNNRVLVWSSIPSSDGAAATFALGQAGGLAGSGSGTTATTLSGPRDAFVANAHLYVSDTGNNRVLEWTSFPSTNGQAAIYAVGQAGLAAGGSGTTAATLSGPIGVRVDSQGRLFVADSTNNRVLIWNQEPSASGTPADGVLGQADFTSSGANPGGGVTATGLDGPSGLDISGGELWISDTTNSRVLESSLP